VADGISVGDAVLTFFGDTSKLDQSFANVRTSAAQTAAVVEATQGTATAAIAGTGQQAELLGQEMNKIPPVSPMVPESFVPVKVNAREARGEVMLLGEAIGVRLPRHVAGFLAELPGVGQALNAAFAVTAVGFLAVAFVEITEKVSEFAAAVLYGAGAAKETMDAAIALNKAIVDLNSQYQTAKTAVEEFGKSHYQLAQDALVKAVKASNDAKEAYEEQTVALQNAKKAADDLAKEQSAITYWQSLKQEAGIYIDALKGVVTGSLTFSQAIAKMTDDNGIAAPAIAKVAEETNNLAHAQQVAKTAAEQATLARLNANAALTAEVKRLIEQEAAEDKALAAQGEIISAANLAYRELGFGVSKAADEIQQIAIKLSPAAQEMLKIAAAMKTTGIETLDLRNKMDAQKAAVETLKGAYTTAGLNIHQFRDAQISAIEAEIAYDKALGIGTAALEKQEQVLKRQNGEANSTVKNYEKMTHADKTYVQSVQDGNSKLQASWAAGGVAFEDMVGDYASGSDSMAQAVEKMIGRELEALSEWAISKAIEQLAEGYANAIDDPVSAASHFASAAEWGLLGGASAVAGHMVGSMGSGGGGASSSGGSSTGGAAAQSSPATATTAQSSVQVVNVQKVAGGGLVSGPTLAIVGDAPGGGAQKEAILPLNDSSAMQQIAAAIAKAGGSGGGDIHVHVAGLISPDNLNKVISQINQRVKSGKSNLTSSNSMRVTKRSQ